VNRKWWYEKELETCLFAICLPNQGQVQIQEACLPDAKKQENFRPSVSVDISL
jgi:hypothetical protein